MVLFAIWYYLYNLKNVKNLHERVLLLAKLYAKVEPAIFLKVTLLHGCFSPFLNCANAKSRNASHITEPSL